MKKTELKSFAAEKILKMRKIKGKSGKHTMVKYQIKFHGYIKPEWIKACRVTPDLIEAFKKENERVGK